MLPEQIGVGRYYETIYTVLRLVTEIENDGPDPTVRFLVGLYGDPPESARIYGYTSLSIFAANSIREIHHTNPAGQ